MQFALKATVWQCILHTQRSPDRVRKSYAQSALLHPGLSEILPDIVGDKAKGRVGYHLATA
jgi:hypothetical protein